MPARETTVPRLAWVAAAVAFLAMLALVSGIVTPPRSGPNCRQQCLSYPYADAGAYVPGDFIWMYPAFGLVLAFVMMIAGLHQRASRGSKTTTLFGLCLAGMAGTVLAADYFLQLVVVQASLVTGEAASMAPLSMYNSRGIFLALEDLGYLLMSVSFVFASAALSARRPLERTVRWLFLCSGALSVLAFVVCAGVYRADLQDHYEVIAIVINWLTLIVAGSLLTLVFGRDSPDQQLDRTPSSPDRTRQTLAMF
jgi:hypothetical protein